MWTFLFQLSSISLVGLTKSLANPSRLVWSSIYLWDNNGPILFCFDDLIRPMRKNWYTLVMNPSESWARLFHVRFRMHHISDLCLIRCYDTGNFPRKTPYQWYIKEFFLIVVFPKKSPHVGMESWSCSRHRKHHRHEGNASIVYNFPNVFKTKRPLF